jgi:two-component system response regulator AtoC
VQATEKRALLIDIDPATQPGLLGFLRGRAYQCITVSSTEAALQAISDTSFGCTLVDLSSAATSQAALIQCLKLRQPNAGPIIAITDQRDKRVDAISPEVEAVLHKPLGLTELQSVIDNLSPPASDTHAQETEQADSRIRRETSLWCSLKMMEARQILREAARVDVTVLVTGETGTGKELVARSIHQFSSRRAGPFVKVNCAAMPRDLLESELFGYERGAFTGAHKLKIGRFETANRGTIFLDEIGDLHPALQAKLLHVLQDGEFSRIGGKSTLTVDVRVLAATNQDLERAVAEGRFREDLFYRLNVVHVFVPPLRERTVEIPLLANYFVERYAKLYGRDGFTIAPAVLDRLRQHRFPGNVRELENLVKRMIVLDDPYLTRVRLPEAPLENDQSQPPAPVAELALKEIGRRASQAAEREAIAKMLEQTGWNRVRTARALRISYRALLYKIKQAGLTNGPSSARSFTQGTPQ